MMNETRRWVETLLYGVGHTRRFTQDSPVLPDVWVAYFDNPGTAIDLLIEPWLDKTSFAVAGSLATRLEESRTDSVEKPGEKKDRTPGPRVASNRTLAIATLTLKQVIKEVIPLTGWYVDLQKVETSSGRKVAGLEIAKQQTTRKTKKTAIKFEDRLPRARELWEDIIRPEQRTYSYPKILAFLRVAGLIAYVDLHGRDSINEQIEMLARLGDEDRGREYRSDLSRRILSGFRHAFGERLPQPSGARLIYAVNRNRPALLAVNNSVRTIKADAANSLFSISCRKLSWAVVDCGIDATHPAFRDWSNTEANGKFELSRVTQTYDFSYFRETLLGETEGQGVPEHIRQLTQRRRGESEKTYQVRIHEQDETIRRIRIGRAVDWEALRPFIEVPHKEESYVKPVDGHGTHVGGIIGADWRDAGGKIILQGVCPDIRLIDIRVCKPNGSSDEFAVISALQFLRHLNANADSMIVHGANLSLSLIADVATYACGRTPVCVEAERNVASGMVTVVAAGNFGFRRFLGESSQILEQYFPASITDPGNADAVITVGSTHRIEPHNYGVSYFSSRGPTGDGRNKPDLVAPGEKIFAPTLEDAGIRLDGTSMAAPHVSGAAAMLMARHVELTGRPQRIKQILCSTATDLGRERYFQGSGLLDVLRAIQSV
jgi:serine protease AprX